MVSLPVATIKNGLWEGEYTIYFNNGGVASHYNYVADNIIGDAEGFYETGELKFKSYYKNGDLFKLKEYTKNGLLADDLIYNNKKKSGLSKSFFESGELSWEVEYKGGVEISAKQYYKGGNIACEIKFKKGKAVSGTNYTFEGKETKMTNAHFHNLGYNY